MCRSCFFTQRVISFPSLFIFLTTRLLFGKCFLFVRIQIFKPQKITFIKNLVKFAETDYGLIINSKIETKLIGIFRIWLKCTHSYLTKFAKA